MVPWFLFGVKEEEFLVNCLNLFSFYFILITFIRFILRFIEHSLYCMLDIIMQGEVMFQGELFYLWVGIFHRQYTQFAVMGN